MSFPLRRCWEPGSLQGHDACSEAIASKDLNNLYRASCYFADPHRYQAFCAYYAIMRVVDDHVDDLLANGDADESDRRQARRIIDAFERLLTVTGSGRSHRAGDLRRTSLSEAGALLASFVVAAARFPLPARLWHDFFAAMRADLHRSKFATYREFLAYAEGAAVAPTTVYLHLIASEPSGAAGPYLPPRGSDLRRLGRDLGRFAYITHVLRDLRSDLSTGANGLLYLSAEDMSNHGLTRESLFSALAEGRSSPNLHSLVCELADRAWALAECGRVGVSRLREGLSPDRAFVLELIVRLYERQLEKLGHNSYEVMQQSHILTEEEKEATAIRVLAELGLRP